MPMKEEAIKILENDGLLLRAFGVFLILSFFLVPGGIFLLIEKTEIYLSLDFPKLVFTSFVLSVPFNIVGFIMVSASFFSNKRWADLPIALVIWTVAVVSCLWGCFNVGVMYINTRLFFNPINDYFDSSFKERYVVNFIVMTLFMMLLLSKFLMKKNYTANKA